MAKNDNLAGVLSPTSGERDSSLDQQHFPAYPMAASSSPRYHHSNSNFSGVRNTPVDHPLGLSQRDKISSNINHGNTLFSQDGSGMEMNANFPMSRAYPSTISPPNGATDSFKQSNIQADNSLSLHGQSARRQNNPVTTEYRQKSPSPHPRTHHHSNTISSIASLISPFPDQQKYDNSYIGMQPPLTRKDMTPWITSSEINRPKSADITPNPKSFSQVLPRSQFVGNSSATAGFVDYKSMGSNLLDPEMQFFKYDPANSWASMTNTPVASNFTSGVNLNNNDMVNTTAIKLAALSVTGSRTVLDTDGTIIQRQNSVSSKQGNDQSSMRGLNSDFRRDSDGRPNIPSKFREQDNSYYDNKTKGMPSDAATGQAMNNPSIQIPSSPMKESSRPLSPQYSNAYSNNNNNNSTMQGMRSPTSWGMDFKFPQISSQQQQQQQQQRTYVSSPFRVKPDPLAVSTDISNQQADTGSNPQVLLETGKQPKPFKVTSPLSDASYIDATGVQDIGVWLKSLRLHKYTECLKDLAWKDLIELSDADLEARGVNALGARRKMLKVFDQIKRSN